VLSREWLKFEGEFVYSNLHRRCRADGDHAMKTDTTKAAADAVEGTLFLRDDWFDPLGAGVRTRIRGFIEELLGAELDAALARKRYESGRYGQRRLARAAAGRRQTRRCLGFRPRGLTEILEWFSLERHEQQLDHAPVLDSGPDLRLSFSPVAEVHMKSSKVESAIPLLFIKTASREKTNAEYSSCRSTTS
jgi:hypothetical protein